MPELLSAYQRHAEYYALRYPGDIPVDPDTHQVTQARIRSRTLPFRPAVTWSDGNSEPVSFNHIPLGRRLFKTTTPSEFDSLVFAYVQERFGSEISAQDQLVLDLRDLVISMFSMASLAKGPNASFDGAALLSVANTNVQDLRNMPLFASILLDCGIIHPFSHRTATEYDVERVAREHFGIQIGGDNNLRDSNAPASVFASLRNAAEVAYGIRYCITEQMRSTLEAILVQY